MINEKDEYISTKELAKLKNICTKTIQRAVKKDELKPDKVGRAYRFTIGAVDEWWKARSSSKVGKKTTNNDRSPSKSNDDLPSEDSISTEKKAHQNERSVALIKIDGADHKQKRANNSESKLDIQLAKFGFHRDGSGIFVYDKSGKLHLTNFSELEYICNKIVNEEMIRIIKINDITMELKPQDLLNSNNFNKKLLSCSNFDLLMEKDQFWNFKNLIRSLDNNKYIIPIPGYGKINDFIINLGNKVFINGKLTKFEETIWVDRTGYKIDKTELISISDQKTSLSKIWDSFHQLYGMQAVLIIGFATATLFFQQYMEQKKHFPLLYVLAGSGRGKNGLTDLICSLSGLNESIVNINCAGNSTKIGVEGKSLLLNNLPLVLNELTEGHFDFIKSRYDGQGSVKFNEKSSNQIAERTVNGSTMITTVVRPLDKQIISRCIFVDLDITKLNKELFDKVKEESADFSSFIIKIIQSIAFPDILDSVMEFRKGINPSKALPRVIDNYSLIGGCFNIFRKMVNNSGDLPTADEVTSFIEEQITITENYLNPLIYFIRELESLLDQPKTTNMFAQDNIHLYFNFQSVWKQISDSYKKKYFPFMNDGNIKRLLLESDYMTVYGADITHNDKKMFGKPVYKYPKKIGAQTKRCYVLLKDKLPGYYR